LSAGHSVDRVVDEDNGDSFSAIERVEGFVGADTCGISVALVGENQVIRQYTFDTGGNGSCTAGGGLRKAPIVNEQKKIMPNDPCPCGSGKKFKQCCGRKLFQQNGEQGPTPVQL